MLGLGPNALAVANRTEEIMVIVFILYEREGGFRVRRV